MLLMVWFLPLDPPDAVRLFDRAAAVSAFHAHIVQKFTAFSLE
jgi:hypothetical protein